MCRENEKCNDKSSIKVINNETGEEESCIWCKRPCWDCVYSAYSASSMESNAAFLKSIGHNKEKFTSIGAISATRVSVALIASHMMKDTLNADLDTSNTVDTISKGRFMGCKFIKDVTALKEWLSNDKIWGCPDEMILAEAPHKINGRDGLCIIEDNGGRKLATLWVGATNSTIKSKWVGEDPLISDGKVYFWELFGANIESRICTLSSPIVIDRYKMPGLNSSGLDIADDMCFGYYGGHVSTPIYDSRSVTNYIEEYTKGGFDMNKHRIFSNNERKNIISKAIYSADDVPMVKDLLFRSEEDLFTTFKSEVIESFTCTEDKDMREVVLAMINRFKMKTGGIYSNDKLTKCIIRHPSTKRYCEQLKEYIWASLKKPMYTSHN